MASERIKALADDTVFGRNIANYHDFISFCRFYPDLMFDLLKPAKGGLNLHLDQRIFLRCDVRFFSMYGDFSRGYGKCISGDSLIYTDKGIKEMGSFFNYQSDNVETYYDTVENIVNRNGEIEQTMLGVYNGKKECNQIITNEGYSLTATKNHRVLAMLPDGKIDWVTTDNLRVGDYVVINRKNNAWGNDNSLSNINQTLNEYCQGLSKQSLSHLFIRQMPDFIDDDLALLCGYLVGDGCLTSDYQILFSNIDEDIICNYKRIMSEKFGMNNIVHRKNSCDYEINDKYLRKYFEILGLGRELSYDKYIPNNILKGTKSVIAHFLRGLFDTDGTVDERCVSVTSVSKKLINQIQIALLNFGIISYVHTKTTKRKFGVAYTLVMCGENAKLFNKEIGFGVQYKQEKINKLCAKKNNTNKDIIPYQKELTASMVCDEANKGIAKADFYNVYSGNNELTYYRLEKLLKASNPNCKLYNHFKELQDNHYYFAKITRINQTVVDTYDFHIPSTHSFVSNGFVSHNTFDEVMSAVAVCLLYPNMSIGISAQTKENAADLLMNKWNELVRYYPLLANELQEKPKFSRGIALIKFKNGSEIDAIANSQSTKGQRRRRLTIEESALLNNALYEDALAPVVEVPRLTSGRLSIVDPCELNQQIHFFTTAGFKGSDEHSRIVGMVDDMENLKGKIVLGASWMLPCWYGRGSSKSQILQKKKNMSLVSFAQNYEQVWVGASDGALVNINKLLNCRIISSPVIKSGGDDEEYYMGVDVARSQKTSNNQSSVVIGKVIRNANKTKIIAVDIVNIVNIPNILNFTAQAVKIKQLQRQYNAKAVICDGNGLGAGLIDCLLMESVDPITGESLGCWDTMNDDNMPEIQNSPQILYNLKAQSCQNEAVTTFIDYVDSGKLKLLERRLENDFTDAEWDDSENLIRPFIETDAFIEETANLKMKHLSNGGITIEKAVKKIDKDRVSAMIYMLWYVEKFARDLSVETEYSVGVYVN